MTGPLLWRHLNSVSTKSLFLLALAYTRFLLQHPLEVSAQHSPPLPVSIPTVMKLNSNHSLPNGGVARVEDHITLTTKRKPWRGPAKMSVSRLEGYKNQIAPVLPSRLKLMSKSERSKFNKELREQQDLLHDIASGKEIDPRPYHPNNISPQVGAGKPASIKNIASDAVRAITTLRNTKNLRWSNKEVDVLNQVANGQFGLPDSLHGKIHTSKYANEITPLYRKQPAQTMDSLIQQSKPSHHGRLASGEIDKKKMEADWNKFIRNKRNLIPAIENSQTKKSNLAQPILSAHHKERLQSFEQRQQQLHSRQQHLNNQGAYGVKGVDIDSFDPFEHVTETNAGTGKKRAPSLRAPPAQSLGVIAGGPRVGVAGNGGGSGSLSAQILQSAPQYHYTKLDKSAWPGTNNGMK